jgi:hypothetical protein
MPLWRVSVIDLSRGDGTIASFGLANHAAMIFWAPMDAAFQGHCEVDYLMFGNHVIYFVEEAEPAPGLVEKRVTRDSLEKTDARIVCGRVSSRIGR